MTKVTVMAASVRCLPALLLLLAVLPLAQPGPAAARWLEGRPLAEWNTGVHLASQEPPARRLWDKLWLERASAVLHFEQLMPIFERLESGEPLTVVGLGSSILASNGGCFNNRSDLYKHVRRPHLLRAWPPSDSREALIRFPTFART